MNSLKKALAGIFVLATIFVAFSCSNASDSDGKPDGNPFKGTKWEGNGMSLTFTSSNTCVLDYGVSSYARATMSSGTEYSYTWEKNDDGTYTATLKIVGSDAVFATFTIDSSGAASGTFYMGGYPIEFGKVYDDEGSDETEDDNYNRYPFVDTEWVYIIDGEEVQSLSFGSKKVVMNHDDETVFFYISEKSGEGYKARLTVGAVNGYFYANFTIDSVDAKEGSFTFMGGEGGVFKRKN